MKLLHTSFLALAAILMVSGFPRATSACSFGRGTRVQGDYLLHTITVTKRASQGPENLEVLLDYKTSPLLNQEITYGGVDAPSLSSCSFSFPGGETKTHFMATLRSQQPITEMTVTLSVYGFNWA
ncbi:uncharacterized protein LOC128730827 [Anopheles nili]|uniref:uncharacterized protein LOC128730827 n=1 Tax=Anopheles nili TaxID=185578 RepID=UPI00237A781E|nr:uncharacterized protein LOC128730827 [Anopheles nili]